MSEFDEAEIKIWRLNSIYEIITEAKITNNRLKYQIALEMLRRELK